MSDIPDGFEPLDPFGKFHELCGPIYAKKTAEGFSVGMRVADKHGNRATNIHGGMLATLVDTAFTYAARHARNPPQPNVTVSLSIDMMGPAKQGDWVEVRVEVGRAGRSTTFLSGFVWVGEQRIARASGVFQARALPNTAA
ncbi:MAG TPA: PaaI family thioesterase [Burkholderiales bacterium]|nr:PaaI family thioesterase [Burkholderiales bacterium]